MWKLGGLAPGSRLRAQSLALYSHMMMLCRLSLHFLCLKVEQQWNWRQHVWPAQWTAILTLLIVLEMTECPCESTTKNGNDLWIDRVNLYCQWLGLKQNSFGAQRSTIHSLDLERRGTGSHMDFADSTRFCYKAMHCPRVSHASNTYSNIIPNQSHFPNTC